MKSSLPFTSVVSYHLNPLTCGVAKFGKQIADRLSLPFLSLQSDLDEWGAFPLWSLKWSEIPPPHGVWNHFKIQKQRGSVGVFWHDSGYREITEQADVAMFADPSLGSPGLWCPSLIEPHKKPVRLFSFGMAHKLQTERYRRVRELLDEAQQPFHLRVSVGLHEGTALDGVEHHFDALKAIMGPEHVTILGILSDDAVGEELWEAHAVIAFFEHGLRANNTTVQSAVAAGKWVLTNHDGQTPLLLRRATINISDLAEWSQTHPAVETYSWDNLIAEMTRICEASRLAPAK